MRPIDTSALSVNVQQRLTELPTSSQDLAATLFGGEDRVDLSPAAQALIGGQEANEQAVTDVAHGIGLTDWPAGSKRPDEPKPPAPRSSPEAGRSETTAVSGVTKGTSSSWAM